MTPNDDQYKVIQAAKLWAKDKSSRIFEFEGRAGTGKTFTINMILQELGIKPNEYMAMAYTGQAAMVMRTRGFKEAKTIHSSLYDQIEYYDENDIGTLGKPRKKYKFIKKEFLDPNIKYFFIDEARMVPTSMLNDILSFGVKIIACGDARQLPPIEGKPAFLKNYNDCYHLNQLMRQSLDNPIIYIAERILNDEPIHLGNYGNTVYVISENDFIPELYNYADIILTGTNRTRDTINSHFRKLAGYIGELPFYGERVICRKNNWNIVNNGIALANGLIGTVVSTPDILSMDKDMNFTIDFATDIVKCRFDDILVNYKYFTSSYESKREMMSNRLVTRWMRGNFFEFAYAITVHLSQGSEHNQGIIFREFSHPQIQKAMDYTAITRFKKSCVIVVKDPLK